jgi:hypothetical protein
MEIGYKVVYPYKGKLVSCRMRPDRTYPELAAACHVYGIGKITRPRPGYGSLAVFKTYEQAAEFANAKRFNGLKMGRERIYLCKYNRSKKEYLQLPGHSKEFSGDDGPLKEVGTDFASAVLLIFRIKKGGKICGIC